MKSRILITLFTLVFSIFHPTTSAFAQKTSKSLSVLDYEKLAQLKESIQFSKVSKNYQSLINSANKALKEGPFSVMQKTQVAASGNKHDYLSLAPYWWPNPDTKDGLPWIRKDGEINPLTRGNNIDYNIKNTFFKNVQTLALAYFFSDNKAYADKSIELLKVWFLDEATKMNPNLNYAQGIPGKNTGRGIGIIEFAGITKVITAIELLEITNALDSTTSKALREWLNTYLVWLQHSEFGLYEKTRLNNHGTHYDVQVASLLLFLNKKDEAKTLLESVKTNRIAVQIEPDGKQPHELKRTKALSYSTMNLRGFTELAFLGKKVGVDLWNYKTKDGASIQNAFAFLHPIIEDDIAWEYEQINNLEKTMLNLKQLFYIAGSIFGIEDYCSYLPTNELKYYAILYPNF